MDIEKTIYQTLQKQKGDISSVSALLDRELRHTVDGLAFWIIILDKHGKCIYTNSEAMSYSTKKRFFGEHIKSIYPYLEYVFQELSEGQDLVSEVVTVDRGNQEGKLLVRGKRVEPPLSTNFIFLCFDLTEIFDKNKELSQKQDAIHTVGKQICKLVENLLEERGASVELWHKGEYTEIARTDNISSIDLYSLSKEFTLKEGEAIEFVPSNMSKNSTIKRMFSFLIITSDSTKVVFSLISIHSDTSRELNRKITNSIGQAVKSLLSIQGTYVEAEKEYVIRENMRSQERNELLQLSVDNLPILLAILDRQKRIILTNKKLEEFCGESKNRLMGITRKDLLRKTNFTRYIGKEYQHTLGQEETSTRKTRCLLTDKNGTQHRFMVYITRASINGKKVEIIASIDNYTEYINEFLNQIVDTLKSSNYALSHDLRGPFNNIGNLSGLTKIQTEKLHRTTEDSELSCEEKLKYVRENLNMINSLLNRIEDNAYDGEELVDAILQFTRIDKQRKKQWVNAQQAASTAIGWVSSLDEETNTVWIAPLPVVLANEVQLKQIFQNLISNAIKYKHPERSLDLNIWSSEDSKGWTFHVSDNGIGIPREHQGKIWNICQSLNKTQHFKKHNIASNQKGSRGIGLAIVKRTVERHGGHVWVESIPDIGSKFSFFLPREETMFDT